MRFRLLEAPALSAKSRKDSPKPALGSDSRSKKVDAPANTPSEGNTFIPSTPEQWEQVLYDSSTDRAFREIACVKWLENNKPGSPLLGLLGGMRKELRKFDADVENAQDAIDSEDAASTFVDPNDNEQKQDKAARATNHAAEQRALDNLKNQTEALRSKVNSIFTAIFIAIDCKSDLFENVIARLRLNNLPSTYYKNLVSLANAVERDKTFNTEEKYLLNLSLYNRQAKDFDYTLKVFNIVHDRSKLANYYDPDKIDIKQLYDGNDIKPTGIMKMDPEDFGTIYGVTETWKETAANENTEKPVKKGKPKDEFSSFEAAEKNGENIDNNVITINGKFKFNAKNDKWEPLKQ